MPNKLMHNVVTKYTFANWKKFSMIQIAANQLSERKIINIKLAANGLSNISS